MDNSVPRISLWACKLDREGIAEHCAPIYANNTRPRWPRRALSSERDPVEKGSCGRLLSVVAGLRCQERQLTVPARLHAAKVGRVGGCPRRLPGLLPELLPGPSSK